MKRFFPMLLLLALALPAAAEELNSFETPEEDTLYQVSTIQALLNGQYDGEVTYADLAEHGDFGIGTFDGLDGEMIAFDGRFYQIPSTGKVREVPEGWGTPFAVVTKFEPDMEITLKYVKDFDDLKLRLEKQLPGTNLFYAVKMEGLFQYVKTRSVPGQEPPYPPLAEVAKQQTVWELNDTIGTVVGFYTPAFGGKVNVPGFHMHYLDQYEQNGGHILDIASGEITVQIDRSPYLFVRLPLESASEHMDDLSHQLEGIEQ